MNAGTLRAGVGCVFALVGAGCTDERLASASAASDAAGPADAPSDALSDAPDPDATGNAADANADTDAKDGSERPLFAAAPVFHHHPGQPFVIDVDVALLEPAALSLGVVEDPGVRVAELTASTPLLRRHRLRGLEPGASLTLRATASVADGAGAERETAFETLPAPPQYDAAAFTFSGTPGPALRYLLVGATDLADSSRRGVYVLDAVDRRPRFFLPADSGGDDPTALSGAVSLLADSTLLTIQLGRLVRLDELGHVLLDVDGAAYGGFHHDAIELPGGHLLALGASIQPVTHPSYGQRDFLGDRLVELSPSGAELWTWSAFAHLDTARVYGDQTFNPGPIDWTHGNAIVHDPRDDSVIVSLREQSWLVKIDRITGTVRWRLGEGGDFSLEQGTWFHAQHAPELGADGSLLVYDNAIHDPNVSAPRSRAVLYSVEESTYVARQSWQDVAEYACPIGGDADRLADGHVLVLDSLIPDADAGQPLLSGRAVAREVDPSSGNAVTFTLRTRPGVVVFRAVPIDRLPGETADAR